MMEPSEEASTRGGGWWSVEKEREYVDGRAEAVSMMGRAWPRSSGGAMAKSRKPPKGPTR